jgi:hypothetical protein
VTKLLPGIITLAAKLKCPRSCKSSASTLGFGGYFQGRWFSSPWPSELSYIMESEMSMAFRELYPIVVAAVLWSKYWIKKRIVFHCDNESMVHIINCLRKICHILRSSRHSGDSET